MTKGIPNPRHQNLLRATAEARRVILATRNWTRTHDHMNRWLRIHFALSTRSVNDYLAVITARLSVDKEVVEALKQPASVQAQALTADFTKASEMETK